MGNYLRNIWETISTMVIGMKVTMRHIVSIRKDNVTLQYPEERWPRPERDIGFDHSNYNVIRSRLHVDIDDCIVETIEWYIDNKDNKLDFRHDPFKD